MFIQEFYSKESMKVNDIGLVELSKKSTFIIRKDVKSSCGKSKRERFEVETRTTLSVQSTISNRTRNDSGNVSHLDK